MPIDKSGTNITAVRHLTAGGTQTTVTQVIHVDGVTQTAVFGAQVSTPIINVPSSLLYNQVTFTVQNTYDAPVTIYVNLNSTNQNASASADGIIGDNPSFTFTGLTSNQTYTITAYATRLDHANSANATRSITTPLVTTSIPSISIITNVWNSLTWRITNEDTAPALITTALFASNGSTQIGTTKTATIAAGATFDATQSGLTASTQYYIKRSAQATDGKVVTSYISSGPHTTAAQETLATPSIVVGAITGTTISWYVQNNSVHTVQIGSNVDSTASWPNYDTSVPPSGNSDTWTKTGLAVGSTHTIYAQAIDPNGFYASSGIAETTVSTQNRAATPSLASIAGGTSTSLKFRITNNDSSSATYTWYLGDWSQSASGSIGASGGTVDFTLTGLSPSTTYTVYAYVAVSGKVDSNSASSSATTSAGVTYLPDVGWVDFTIQGNNLIRVTYEPAPLYFTTLEYEVNYSGSYTLLTCNAPSAGANYTVPAGGVRVRVRNRVGACSGNQSENWTYSVVKTVPGAPA